MHFRSPSRTPATVVVVSLLLVSCRSEDPVAPAAGARAHPVDPIPAPAPEPAPPPTVVDATAGTPTPAAVEPPTPPAEATPEHGGWTVGASDDGRFEVAWRATGGAVPRNEPFEMEVLVRRGGDPVEGATVKVRGWMPDHGHGMVREPLVREVGGGRYHVEGMLLHMRGEWDLLIDVTKDGVADTARSALEL